MQQPNPGTMQYSQLLAEIEKGAIKIPQFQRDYVWDKERAARLIDSILKGYPIGTFILWKTKERLRSIRNIGGAALPEPPDGDFVLYVLDGQQRVTSLYAGIYGSKIHRHDNRKEDFSEIYIDLEVDLDKNGDNEIVVTQMDNGREPNTYISLTVLVKAGIFSLSNKYNEKYFKKIEQYKENLSKYLFPIVTVQDAPIDVATEIFTRLNIQGKDLSVFEIMSAKMFDYDRDFDLSVQYDDLIEKWSGCGYETIPNSTVLQAVSSCLVKECGKKHILSLKRDNFIDEWENVVSAIDSAIDYFRAYYRIPVSQLLPYDGLLLPFTYFFYKHPDKPSDFQRKYLQDFFWRTTLSSRYSSALETRIGQDIKRIDDILLGKVPIYDYGVDITVDALQQHGYFTASKAYVKGILCILASKEPKSFQDGARVNIDNSWLKRADSKNYHHFFPKAHLAKLGLENDRINHIANITIVDDFLNKRVIRDKAPSKYMKDFENENGSLSEHMKTHLINDLDEFGVWTDDYDEFFIKRLQAFSNELLNRLVMTKLDKA